jgi:exosortase A
MNFPLRIKLGIIAGLLIVAYWPTFIWMNARFSEADTYYSHGFLVPFVFLYLIWAKRDDLKKAEISPLNIGLILLVPTLLVHLLAHLLGINFVSGFSLIVALSGLSLYLYGLGISRQLAFAILFLVFMIPLPQVLIINISFKMKIFAAQIATICINLMGIQAVREGSIVNLPNTALTVGDPCSGLRSLISLTALGALYAYLIKISKVRKVLLFLLSIPIALIANIIRIILLLLVAFVYGSEVATGKFHDFSGFLLFGFAFAGLFIVGRILSWQREK